MNRCLVLLARAPVPGQGKTRLRETLSGPQVDALASAFFHDTVQWSVRVAGTLLIAYTGPAPALPGVDATVVPQVDGDLGARIDGALAHAFAIGADEAVLIGSDSPDLPEYLLTQCFAELAAADTTLIPADDGGWVAIGARRPLEGCLASVPWSADTTCAETIAALKAADRRPRVLKPWYDVDDVASLQRLSMSLSTEPDRAPRTARVIVTLSSRGWDD